jgi:hypothetical protein
VRLVDFNILELDFIIFKLEFKILELDISTFFGTGKQIGLLGTMNISIINALWAIITGERLDIEDPNLNKAVKILNEFVSSTSLSGTSPLALVLPRSMTKWPILDKLSGFKMIHCSFTV